MIEKQKILEIIDEHIIGTPLFLVDLKITTDNRISVFIDGDEGVTIDNCIGLSRAIEKNFDREVEDYELNVFSSGLGEPLKLKRQYLKNVGRSIQIETTSGETFEGKLAEANDDEIIVELSRSKKKKTGKELSEQNKHIPFESISDARIVITF